MAAISRPALPVSAVLLALVALHDVAGVRGPAITPIRDVLFLTLATLCALIAASRAARGESRRFAWAMLAMGLTAWEVGYVSRCTSAGRPG